MERSIWKYSEFINAMINLRARNSIFPDFISKSARKLHTNALIPTLKARGLISQLTSDSFENVPEQRQLGVYLGADPSADSLHLGNLIPFMVLIHFYIRGHKVFPLIGGATGIVGDPSGRNTERAAMEAKQRQINVEKISEQMMTILRNSERVAQKYTHITEASSSNIVPVNNYSWWKDVNLLWFLGTFGGHIRVSSMLARESVRQRLKSEAGIGYNEFSYQILQAYDFYHLYKHHNCQCQIGGHDQWGNITAGVELINRLIKSSDPHREPLGLTVPLLTTPSGKKFGKSAGNAVFLSSERTKPYHLFQYLVKSPDDVVEKYLKIFTFIPLNEVSEIMSRHSENPELRSAQRRLALEVTELVHGPELATSSEMISSVMFGESKGSPIEILEAFKSQGLSRNIPHHELLSANFKTLIADLSGKSKSEVQRLIKNGSVYIGTERQTLKGLAINDSHLNPGNVLLIRIGKTEYYVVESTM